MGCAQIMLLFLPPLEMSKMPGAASQNKLRLVSCQLGCQIYKTKQLIHFLSRSSWVSTSSAPKKSHPLHSNLESLESYISTFANQLLHIPSVQNILYSGFLSKSLSDNLHHQLFHHPHKLILHIYSTTKARIYGSPVDPSGPLQAPVRSSEACHNANRFEILDQGDLPIHSSLSLWKHLLEPKAHKNVMWWRWWSFISLLSD